jgi:diguanylate cyclase (GGDEF)-like protein
MAYVDFLTSLPNRRYLDEKLRRFDAGGADGGSVVLFDVDHFKSVNDTYGHHVGDHVLREIALVAAGHLRDGQLLGRWGGEEFVLLLPDQDEETAARIVERVRRALDTHTFAEVGHVTASFGVAERQPGESVTSTVDRADAAMYAAKRAGRNRVVTASTLAQEASALAESPDLDVETHAVSTASGSPR